MGGTGERQSGGSVERLGNVIFGADRQVASWVAARIPGFRAPPLARALGVIKGDAMAAGVVFDNWNGIHVEAAIAAEEGVGWADRRTLHSLFYYPFGTLGCKAISVSVPSSNLASLNLATKLGFEAEAIIRYAAHDGSSLVIMKMFRETCKWIDHHGEKGLTGTRSTGPQGDGSSGIAIQPA